MELCFRAPPVLLGMPSPPMAAVGVDVPAHQHHCRHGPAPTSAVGRNAAAGSAMEAAPPGPSRHSYMYSRPMRRLWRSGDVVDDGGNEKFEVSEERGERERGEEESEEETAGVKRRRRDNWVLKILRVRSIWSAEWRRGGRNGGDGFYQNEERWVSGEESGDRVLHEGDHRVSCCDCEGSEGCHVGEEGGEVQLDGDSFRRMLRRVSLEEARLFAKLSYLGRLAYKIPEIKPPNLLNHRLRFVTSSFEMKPELPKVKKVHSSAPEQEMRQRDDEEDGEKHESQKRNGRLVSASSAYQIAASAASYLHSQTGSILPFRSARSGVDSSLTVVRGNEKKDLISSEVASFVATTNSVTAVVAAKEETKQAVAKDLNSAKSSPCEWFICDDDSTGTRFFVIQGSESLASWQANLLFEPTQFEGLDVLVHRGIYEAAKGIYQQMLPHVRGHLKSQGNSATFRFTGHSLGGSLSLLVNLLLLVRGEVPSSCLLPVVTFGSPYIMCGGGYLLHRLGLPLDYVQAITIHRDIVPRAFSCNYPDHVAEILKALNGKFRNHPCLKHRRLLYAPMGRLLILQPEEDSSPHHHLLPLGTGLYVLGHESPTSDDSTRILRAAQSMFLNSPHPLEILRDRAAYGCDGTVLRDHDMNTYLRSLRGVFRRELQRTREARRERRRQMLRPLVAPQGISESIVMGRQAGLENPRPLKAISSVVFHGGMESLRKFGRFVASRHGHMLLVLLLPAKTLFLGVFRVVS